MNSTSLRHTLLPPQHIRYTDNIRYAMYFVRECTGPVIALYIIYFVASAIFDTTLSFLQSRLFEIISYVTFAASVVHSITWLWVTAKITPFNLSKSVQIGLFLLLIAAWVAVSFFALSYLYIPTFT